MTKKKWFKKAVYKKKPYKLNWKKNLPSTTRRRLALASRPKNWSLKRKYLSTARALQALVNVQKDRATKRLARIDSQFFYRKYHAKR